ncbi:hypothetical protein ABC977_04990 [Thioalkalicoccus limnaeus]|uniref:Protein BatD n=1 Tax=Thioalkalicoccus limnaeus TaxID=120681 RepID=A0ABV4BBB3_9GAMM
MTESRPYQLENVLVRVRLVSDANLATANPEALATDDALWQRLAGPTTYPRVSQGRSEIVNEYVYILRPLRAGHLEVPPIVVSGREIRPHGQDGPRYEAISQPVHLQVQPAEPGVTPWLPLQGLTLKADLDDRDRIEPGRPVRLALQLEAVGATGDQLPSLETQLRASDLRLYRERTSAAAHLSSDGRLVGQRTEYYTLVPEAGRHLRLPELRVAWWNTETGAREVAALPIQTLGPAAASGFNLSRPSADWRIWDPLWLPLIVLTLLLIGYWVGVGLRQLASSRRRHPRATPSPFVAASAFFRDRSRVLIPRRQARWVLDRLLRALPPATRLRRRIRFANRATTPAEWLTRFQQRASWHGPALGASTGRLTEQVLRSYPAANRERIEILERQLDGAIYAGQELDLPRWKGQLGREISFVNRFWRSYRSSWLQRPELPPLNPR